ncbi:MAG: M48 family metallopeptidase [Henriciella sp.]
MDMTIVMSIAQSGTFDTAAAIRAYLDAMPPELAAKTARYHEGQIWLIPIAALIGLIIAIILMQTGFIRRLRDRMEGTMPKWLAVFPFTVIFLVVSEVLSLPFDYYVGFIREHAYDLATQTPGEWLTDWGIGLLIGNLIGGFAIGGLYLLIKAFKRSWWMIGTVASAGFIYLMMALSPVYISPLFNDYTPLEAGELRDNLLAMATAQDIPVDDVVVYTSSDQSNRITANVAGVGNSARIALGDTLIEQAELDEIRFVMAHEMAHYKMGHTTRSIVFYSIFLGLGFVCVHYGFGWANRRFGKSWDIKDIGDLAGMPLFFAMFGIVSVFLTPLQYNYVRFGEVEADKFALDVSRNPDGLATSALRLSTYRELEPEPWEEMLFRHHPSGLSRVTRAMNWKAEQLALQAPDQTPELELERAYSIFADSPASDDQ